MDDTETAPELDPEIQAILDDESARLSKVFEQAQDQIRLAYLQDRVVELARDNAALKTEVEALRSA